MDLKSEAINKYLENNIEEHIMDTSIHFPFSQVDTLVTKLVGLTKSTIVRIPTYVPGEEVDIGYVKDIIKKMPKNLGGYSLIFEFCVPVSKMFISNERQVINTDKQWMWVDEEGNETRIYYL